MIFWTTLRICYRSRVLTRIRAAWQAFFPALPPILWRMPRQRLACRLVPLTSSPVKLSPILTKVKQRRSKWRSKKRKWAMTQRSKNRGPKLQNGRLRKRERRLWERSARPGIRKGTKRHRRSSSRRGTRTKRKRKPRTRWRTRRAKSKGSSRRKANTKRRAKSRGLRQKRPRSVNLPATFLPFPPSRPCPSCQWWADPHHRPIMAWTKVAWVDSGLRGGDSVEETSAAAGDTWTTLVGSGDLPCPQIMVIARWCLAVDSTTCLEAEWEVAWEVAWEQATTMGLLTDHFTEET